MNAIVSYVQASLEELRHVQWPTQQQAVRLSAIVLGFIVANALFFGVVDALLTQVISFTLPSS